MIPACTAGQSADNSARIHIPIRSAETGESGNYVYSAGIADLAGEIFTVCRIVNEHKLVPEPLNKRSCRKNASLERIGVLAVKCSGDR